MATRRNFLTSLSVATLFPAFSPAFCFSRKQKPKRTLKSNQEYHPKNSTTNNNQNVKIVRSWDDLLDGMELEIEGKAGNSKPWPTIRHNENFWLYAAGFGSSRSWPEKYQNKTLRIQGKIKIEYRPPPPSEPELYAGPFGYVYWIIPDKIEILD